MCPQIDMPDVFIDNDYRAEYNDALQIDVDTFDNLLFAMDVNAINYLSITVNGAEHEDLKGCKNILDNSNHMRVYSKRHARIGDATSGHPINKNIAKYLEAKGYNTVLTRGERSTATIEQWKCREGDVFGWKTESGCITN